MTPARRPGSLPADQIQLHRLEGFYWVARTGGYAKAARAFPYGITQPAIHQQVKKLEAELGLVLFERVAKDEMQLTAAGRRLYEFAAPFFEGLPGVVRSLRGGEYQGVLSIQASGTMLRHLLPSWLKRLQRARPGIRIELGEIDEHDLSVLRRGRADLVVDYLPEVPDDIATLRVATMRAFLVFPSSHRLARRKRLSPADFAGEVFVSYTRDTLPYTLQMKGLAAHGVRPEKVISAGTADTILGIVASELGYSLVPSIQKSGPRGRGLVAIPLTSPKVEFPVYAAWRKDMPENPLLDAALETAPRV